MNLTWKQLPVYALILTGLFFLSAKGLSVCFFGGADLYILSFLFIIGWVIFDISAKVAELATQLLSDVWHSLFDKED